MFNKEKKCCEKKQLYTCDTRTSIFHNIINELLYETHDNGLSKQTAVPEMKMLIFTSGAACDDSLIAKTSATDH
jgi:hypothetical protein